LDGKAVGIFNNVIDLLFLLDILVAFRTTFFDIHSGEEVFESKKTAIVYLKSRFFVDFVSTVPVDTISEYIFKTKNKNLSLFSTLKLVRVTRVSRMIARLNVGREAKHVMKLTQLIFFLVMYLHILGCVWFWVVTGDNIW
jgi:Ion transport protein